MNNIELSEEFRKSSIYKGLEEVNALLEKHDAPSVNLNVIGGCAMILHGYKDPYRTDIDYVGENAFTEELMAQIDKIGKKNGLGAGWINNDVLLSGNTLEDMECATGKLHFYPVFEMSKINVSVLDAKDLLRMKVIAVDTSLTALEMGGEFTRLKDLPDIAALMDKRNLDILGLELEIYQISDISDMTYKVIDEYHRNRDIAAIMDMVKPKGKEHTLPVER